MMPRVLIIASTCLFALVSIAADAGAKGLDELGAAPAQAEPTPTDGEAEESGADATSATPASTETAATVTAAREVTEKMYLSTSFGWVSPSRSEGDWRGAGMSDVTFGYKLPVSLGNASLYGTYRYAPVVVAGKIDSNSYRGVWDMHYFGALGSFALGGFDLIGTFELGYVLVYLDSVDGIDLESKHEENGVSVNLGTGADWEVLGAPGFKLGPRVHAGFGGFTTLQFGAAATFMF